MSIKKKIISSFLLSTTIIILLILFEYLSFFEISKEISNLEFTDTIRSKSLQLRRHEKNFFLLYPSKSDYEWNEIQRYLNEISKMLNDNKEINKNSILRLKYSINKYKEAFESIKDNIDYISKYLSSVRKGNDYEKIKPLVKVTFLEQPLVVSKLLEEGRIFSPNDIIILKLNKLYTDIQMLRKYGEDIVFISRELDWSIQQKLRKIILFSKAAILIFFPLFFVVGILLLLFVTNSIVNRLTLLTSVIKKVGKGEFKKVPLNSFSDEVGILIKRFNEMEDELFMRDEELKKKNEELLQSKKLAAVGTLAAGIAHELNNPLNNIYISAQVLRKESLNMPVNIQEIIDDIMNQSMRVKHIISDLLEFTKEREPQRRETDIRNIILGSYKFVSMTKNTENVNFNINTPDEPIIVKVDPEQMERVFINLFNNAIDAMDGKGNLNVTIEKQNSSIAIKVTDTGKGIPAESLEKVFEPFYSTKQKGTGLGLAIVYNIIQKHNGKISVESEEGKGTTFTIILETAL